MGQSSRGWVASVALTFSISPVAIRCPSTARVASARPREDAHKPLRPTLTGVKFASRRHVPRANAQPGKLTGVKAVAVATAYLPARGARGPVMFFYRVLLFSLFGFDVYVDASWLLLAVLIAWSLAVGILPGIVHGLAPATYWSMAVIATIGLLFSIVFHEMAHSLVARRFAMPIRGITLFIFGGVAEMRSEPPSAGSEFLMALAGPVASAVLGLLMLLLYAVVAHLHGPPAISGILWYLGYLNWVLAVFNLLPAFPLDGGRMLRAALWGWRKDLVWATWVASGAGNIFGILLVVLGLGDVLRGDFIAGIWMTLIGLFLRSAANATYQQTIARQIHAGQPVSRFMNRQPITVPPNLSIRTFVEDYVYRYHHKLFPVVRDGRLLGCISTAQIADIDPERWDRQGVAEIMERCSADNVIAPETDTLDAMMQMQRTGRNRLLVARGDQLLGIVSLTDLLEFLTLKLDLEGRSRQNAGRPLAGEALLPAG
jgi:Zn-dependent protease/CBS domain-containing protein